MESSAGLLCCSGSPNMKLVSLGNRKVPTIEQHLPRASDKGFSRPFLEIAEIEHETFTYKVDAVDTTIPYNGDEESC